MDPDRRSPAALRVALALAACLALLLALVALGVPDGLDARVAQQAAFHVRPAAQEAADQLSHLSDGRYGVGVGVLAILACGLLGGLRGLVVAVVLMGAANVTGLLLDPHFVRELTGERGAVVTRAPASAPSNHAILSSSLAVAVTLAAPARLRPLAFGCGLAWVLLIAGCVLALRTHVVSDVVTGWVLTAAWTAVALAVRRAAPRRPRALWLAPPAPVRAVGALVLLLVAVVGAAVSGATADVSDALSGSGAVVPVAALAALVALGGAVAFAALGPQRSTPGAPDADRRAKPSDGTAA